MDSGKCSRRLRPRTTELAPVLLLGALAISGPVGAQTPAAGADTLDTFLENVQTLAANFTQELWSADQQLIETSDGTLELARPNRFVWHYRNPSEQKIVADGTRLWMYDVELAQVTVTPMDELEQANPAMLLGGDREVRDSFDIVQTFSLDGRDWVRLAPKGGGTDFTAIAIAFRDGRPEELEFVDGLDQTTRIEFSDLKINPALGAATFEFAPPAGVDVFGDEG